MDAVQSPADGALDWIGRKRVLAPFGALSLACAALHRRAPAWLADYGKGARFKVRAEEPVCWQADGDYLGFAKELSIEVLPRAVTLLVPRGEG